MLNLAGKPLIGHVIDAIANAGVDRLEIVVGYRNEVVERYVKETYSHLNPHFPFQKKRLGLGHAVLQGLEDVDDPVLIVLGDTVVDVDFSKFVQPGNNVVGVYPVPDPERFGIVELEDDRVVRVVEKPSQPKSNLILAGIYYLRSQRLLKQAIEYLIEHDITTKGEYQLTDALGRLIETGEEFKIHRLQGWYDCGTKESLLESHAFLLQRTHNGRNGHNYVVHPPVFIHPEAQVENSIIGPNVTIDKGAQVKDTVLRNSVVGKNARISGLVLADSLIGENALAQGRPRVLSLGDFSQLEFY